MKKNFAIIKSIFIIALLLSAIIVPIALKMHNEAVKKHLYDLRDMQKESKMSPEMHNRAKSLVKATLDNVKIYSTKSEALDTFYKKVGKNGDRDAFTIYPTNCKVNCKFEIYISDKMKDSDLDAIIAHEFLHVVYKNDRLEKNQTLSDELRKNYNNNPQLQKSLQSYNSTEHAEESFSYLCTEHSDSKLTEYVLNLCNKYINRDKLVMLY